MAKGKASLGAPELRDRLLAPCGLLNAEGEVVGVDLGALVRRLLLFEEYVVESSGLREIPFLVEALGADGVVTLFKSGALRIAADQWYVAQIGQSDVRKPGSDDRVALPLGSFAFSTAAILPEGYFDPAREPGSIDVFKAARRYYFDEFKAVLPIQGKASQRVREATGSALVQRSPGPLGEELFENLATDLTGHPAILKRAVAHALAERLGDEVQPEGLVVSVHQIHERVFTVETDFRDRFGLSAEDEHKVVERGMLGVAGVNHRIDDMKTYRALSGLQRDELPILEEKFSSLASQLDPDRQEERFDRVVELAGLPEVERAAERAIDVDQLLEVRSSEECRDFRVWLRRLDSADDKEIKERVSSLAEAAARVVHSRRGKVTRFVVTNGLGIGLGLATGGLAAPAGGIGLDALDQFVVDKVIGPPGPASFLHGSYRSLFEG